MASWYLKATWKFTEDPQHDSGMNYIFMINSRILRLLGMITRTTVEELKV
jgi:hypothetical protein